MPDIYLRAGHANPNDIVLRDPTTADSGGSPPPITGTAAVTEAVSTTAASGVTAFVGDAAVTQAVSVTAASGVSSFTGTGAVTQAVSTTAASGVSSFVGQGAVTQAVSVVAASGVSSFVGQGSVTEAVSTTTATGTVVNPSASRTGTAAVTQAVSTTTAAGAVANPAPPFVPSAAGQFTRRRRLAAPITGRVHIDQRAQSVEAFGMVRQRRTGTAVIVGRMGLVVASGAVDDWLGAEDEELLLG